MDRFEDGFVEGTLIVFMGSTIEQVRWGGNDDPKDLLEEGQIYALDHCEIHSYHSKIYLKDFPGKKFNSVCFSRYSSETDHPSKT